MAGAYYRLAELQVLGNGAEYTQKLENVIDVLAYSKLHIQIYAPQFGGGSTTVYFQHAPVLEEGRFADISGASVTVLAAGGVFDLTVLDPYRFVRWRTDTVSGSLNFLIDVIARDC